MTDIEPTIAPEKDEADKPAEPGPKKKTSRRAWIMRGVVTPALGLLAVASFAFGALNYTIWKPNPKVTAAAAATSQRYIVTDPGVADLGDSKVSVDVKSTSDSVCVALGETRDVAGWVTGHSYTRVTGLSDWEHLTTEDADATASAGADTDESNDVAFDKSDMWSQVKCGEGTVDVTWDVTDGNQVLLIDTQAKASGSDANQATQNDQSASDSSQDASASASKDASSAANTTVDLTWVRSKTLDLGTPFMVAGGLLTIAAVAMATVFAMDAHRRRNKKALAAPAPAPEPVDMNEPPAWTRGAKPANAEVELTITGMMKPIDAPLADDHLSTPAIVDIHNVNMLERTAAQAAPAAGDAQTSEDQPFTGQPSEDQTTETVQKAETTQKAQAVQTTDEFAQSEAPLAPVAPVVQHAPATFPLPEPQTPASAQAVEAPASAQAVFEASFAAETPALIPETSALASASTPEAPAPAPAPAQTTAESPESALASLVNATPTAPADQEFSNVEITAEGEAISQTPEFDDYFSRLMHETQEVPPINEDGTVKRRRSRREMREARERMKKEKGRK